MKMLALLLLAVPQAAGLELSDATFAKWRVYLEPRPEECRWREVRWKPAFWEAVVEAQRDERPILLWAMNGHPLACT